MTASTATQFDKYGDFESLGEGGFGKVFKAVDVSLGRTVVIKELRPQLMEDEVALRNFEQEAQRAARINHPHVVTIYESGRKADGTPYIAMEYVDGPSLHQLLEKQPGRRLPADKALAIFEDISAGLDAVHRTGLLHRDIKPSNILLTQDGRAKLSDFGLAAALNTSFVASSIRKGVSGSAGFIAPESEEDGEYSAASDIYALGQVLYLALAGRRRHFGDPPLHQLNPQLPPAVTAVVDKAMAREPDQRYATAGAMLAALKQALQQPVQPAKGKKKSRRGALTLALLAVVGLLIAAVIVAPQFLDGGGTPAAPATTPVAEATAALDAPATATAGVQIAALATQTAEATGAQAETETAEAALEATRVQAEMEAVSATETAAAPVPTATPDANATDAAATAATATQEARATQTAEARTAATQAAQAASATQTAEAQEAASAAAAARTAFAGGLIFDSPQEIASVESSHPYEINLDKSWFISNDSGSNAMQIFFSRIEIEDGVDLIQITDPDGGLLQEITSSYPDGLWTDILPGPGAYVVLKTDSADVRWGFRVEAMAPGDYTTLARSAHPYPNNYNGFVVLTNNDANPPGTRVVFDRIEMEDLVDYIVISDVDGNPYQWITGSHPDGLTSKAVPGSAVQVRLVSDGSVQAWGFNIVAVESAPPDRAESPPVGSSVLAETDHPHCGDCEKTWTITNPDTNAVSSKIRFTRIELATNAWLQVLDANDTVIQAFDSSTRVENFWSDVAPGRVVKLKLRTSWQTAWGFRVDAIATSVPNPGLAQSDHPHCGDCEQTWAITNPDTTAVSSKIHFTRIELATNAQLQILDANDIVIQTFGSSTRLENFWSDYVPGRIVKLKLRSSWQTAWGFRVDAIATSVPNPGLAQSDHPHCGDCEQTWTITNPDTNAVSSRIHFAKIELATNAELQILDASDTVIQAFRGSIQLEDVWSDYVPGRIVKLKLRSSWQTAWGFRADLIESK